jgi:hypothetical protein
MTRVASCCGKGSTCITPGSGALGILGESSNRSNAAPSAAKSTRLDALLELGRKRAIQNASAGERSPGEENQKVRDELGHPATLQV